MQEGTDLISKDVPILIRWLFKKYSAHMPFSQSKSLRGREKWRNISHSKVVASESISFGQKGRPRGACPCAAGDQVSQHQQLFYKSPLQTQSYYY